VAWLQAMLDFEAALARASANVGLVEDAQAQDVAASCRAELFDLDQIGRSAAAEATPVIAVVARLRDLVPPEARNAVHLGATSQDALDTAATLVARRALQPLLSQVSAVAEALAELARAYRDAPQVGRTLLQHAAVTTFGAACAARLVAVDEAVAALCAVREERLAVQLGGPVGTLGHAGTAGPRLVAELARELELAEPVVPWHTTRGRMVELSAALGLLCGELAAIAQDVALLSSTDIGEVSVAAPGGSSSMPHKRNPAPAVLALACAHRVPALVATMLAAMPQELQRSAGRWQAEWGTLTDVLSLAGGVAYHCRRAVEGLRVDDERMAANVARLLAVTGTDVVDVGSAGAFVDRALDAHTRRAR
jgi:3-carboxy-cis,cis-muconate cycloisomerase